jgi:hypothetical protein
MRTLSVFRKGAGLLLIVAMEVAGHRNLATLLCGIACLAVVLEEGTKSRLIALLKRLLVVYLRPTL